jgi:pyruvate, water dikinase
VVEVGETYVGGKPKDRMNHAPPKEAVIALVEREGKVRSRHVPDVRAKTLRRDMEFKNVIVMNPFCRSAREADRVLEVTAEIGVKRDEDGLEICVLCGIPSNVSLAKRFAQRFDGVSIGSNDLSQLTLGDDGDSPEFAGLLDEQDDAVKWMIRSGIDDALKAVAMVGLCGQAPSDHPEFARFLVDCGIDSISVSPDSFLMVKSHVASAELAARMSTRRRAGGR